MIFSFFRKRRKRAETAAALKRTEELGALQYTLGERALEAIKKAVSENSVHSLECKDAGPMWVGRMPQNGGVYSVTVYMEGTNGWYGGRERTMYFALQFNVHAHSGRVHALYGRYGPEEECGLNEFDELLTRACDHVREWRLYRSEAA